MNSLQQFNEEVFANLAAIGYFKSSGCNGLYLGVKKPKKGATWNPEEVVTAALEYLAAGGFGSGELKSIPSEKRGKYVEALPPPRLVMQTCNPDGVEVMLMVYDSESYPVNDGMLVAWLTTLANWGAPK